MLGPRMPVTPVNATMAYVDLAHLVRLRGHASGFTLLPRQKPGSVLAGLHASRLRGRGLAFEELRHYEEGDDVRLIDWHATARTRTTHVRVYREERDRPVLLLVDQRRSMFFGSRYRMKSAAAAEIAALAAWRVHASGDRVGAAVFDDTNCALLRPARGRAAVTRLLETVVQQNSALHADGGPSHPGMLNAALELAWRIAKHDALVLLISDAAGADEKTRELVGELARHNDVVSVFVYDPLEASLPPLGRVVLAEGDERLAIDLSARGVRQAHASAFDQREAAISAFGRQRAVPVLKVRTDSDVGAQIRAALSRPRPS